MAPQTRRNPARSAKSGTSASSSPAPHARAPKRKAPYPKPDAAKPAASSTPRAKKSSDDAAAKVVDGSDRGHLYWLMKAEPESRIEKGVDVKFSIDDLKARREPEGWDGVRNTGARNNMRAMKKGDLAFFYHSNCKVPGIAGIMEIVREASVDLTAQDPNHPYYDEKETAENPKWSMVHVEFRRKFAELLSLKELQKHRGPAEALEDMQTLRMSRLSVSKVSKGEWDFIMGLIEEAEKA